MIADGNLAAANKVKTSATCKPYLEWLLWLFEMFAIGDTVKISNCPVPKYRGRTGTIVHVGKYNQGYVYVGCFYLVSLENYGNCTFYQGELELIEKRDNMNIGDIIKVIKKIDKPSEGERLIGREGIIVALDLKNNLIQCEFTGLDDRRYTAGKLIWWLYVWEVKNLTADLNLPPGVFRCSCGATTNRKEQKCCDCIKGDPF
jgi:hypothetical protein